ncbi:MAG TPA: CARDB domain-containing protein [Gaiellaceae bacterium]
MRYVVSDVRERVTKLRLLVGGLALIACALAAGAFLVLRSGSDHGGGDDSTGTKAVIVRAGKETAARFDLGGERHEAKLIETVGSSARIVFSSESPNEVTLTRGIPLEVDLNSDSVADAGVTLTKVAQDSVQLEIAPLDRRAWNETSFATSGGFRPYNHWNNAADEDFSVVPQDGSNLLLYISGDRKLNWERYETSGALVTSPALALGTLDVGTGNARVRSVDGAVVGGRLAAVVLAGDGVSLRSYDENLVGAGQPLYIGKQLANPIVVPVGERAYVIASGKFDPPQSESGPARLIVTEADLDNGPIIVRQKAVTNPQGRELDIASDAAFDSASGRLVVAYKHRLPNNKVEIRLSALDPETLTPAWTSVVAPGAGRGVTPNVCVAASGGKATVVWIRDSAAEGGHQLNVVSADLASGELNSVWGGPVASSSPRMVDLFPCELVGSGSSLSFAYFDTHAKPDAPVGSPDRGRFVLWPWNGSAWASRSTILEGGKPLYADPMFDLNAFAQLPLKAICGAPVALKGKIVNRGSRPARAVTVTATVSGQEVGSVTLATMAAASSADFSIPWTVPADLAEEKVEVSFSLTTASEEYTTGNNAASSAVVVRQKGLVMGHVVNASSDLRHRTGWYPSLENTVVTIGDRMVLTDVAGTFTIDDLEFGSYPVVVEKEGFNRLETQVTVSRTKPLAFVPAEMDNHGVITLRVVDDSGVALEGVDVYLHDYDEQERTPSSGELSWDISARTYTFSFVKRGYQPVPAQDVEVVLGQERTQTITMHEITTGFLGGRVVDRKGAPVGSATITITNARDEVVARPAVSAGGTFEPVELLAKPAQRYTVTVSGIGLTLTEEVMLYGGDDFFFTYGLVPGRGELRVRSTTQGYTSWMIDAGWPGLGPISGADMYAWFGNYAISVGAEYWKGTDELSAVDVTAWGGTYETHATKSEVDFSSWFEPEDTGSVFDITKWADIPDTLAKDHSSDLLDIAGALVDGFSGDEADDDSVVTGQGSGLLTWKQAKRDFSPEPEFDSSAPLESMWNVVDAVPSSFAIPIVIGGSSEQQTAVRVDQVDVVRLGSGQPVELSGPGAEWASFQGPEGTENQNGKRYEVVQSDVPYDEVVVYVWLTVQRYWQGTPGVTCFQQREQQVVVFHPGSQRMEGFIAPGDLYRDPSRMTP